MTHRIEPMRKKSSKNWTFFLKKYDSKNWTFLFFQYDSKNWTFFNMTQRIEPLFEYDTKNWISFLNTTQWIEPIFSIWLNELNLDSKNWFFSKRMTQRIEISWAWVKGLNFWVFVKKKKTNQRIELFSKIRYTELNFFFNMTQFFSKYDSKNLTLHFTMTHIFFKKKKKWLKELILFLNYDSPNIFFWSTNATHRTEFFFSIRLTEFFFEYMTFFFFWHWTFFLNSTQRIEIL